MNMLILHSGEDPVSYSSFPQVVAAMYSPNTSAAFLWQRIFFCFFHPGVWPVARTCIRPSLPHLPSSGLLGVLYNGALLLWLTAAALPHSPRTLPLARHVVQFRMLVVPASCVCAPFIPVCVPILIPCCCRRLGPSEIYLCCIMHLAWILHVEWACLSCAQAVYRRLMAPLSWAFTASLRLPSRGKVLTMHA